MVGNKRGVGKGQEGGKGKDVRKKGRDGKAREQGGRKGERGTASLIRKHCFPSVSWV